MGFEQEEQEKLKRFQTGKITVVELMKSYSSEDLKVYYAEQRQADINDEIHLLNLKYPALRMALSYQKGGYGLNWFEEDGNVYDLSEPMEIDDMLRATASFKFGVVTSDGKFYNVRFSGHYNLAKWLQANNIDVDNSIAVSVENKLIMNKYYGASGAQTTLGLYSPFDVARGDSNNDLRQDYIMLSRRQVRALENLARFHDASIEESVFLCRKFGLLQDESESDSSLRKKVGKSNIAIMSEVLGDGLNMLLMKILSESLNGDVLKGRKK